MSSHIKIQAHNNWQTGHVEVMVSAFLRLPNSTNAVESHNQLCKGATPYTLSVALMAVYKIDRPQHCNI